MLSYRQPGTILTDRVFTVPLDHTRPGGEQIELFGREIVAAGGNNPDLPWLVFLQGGPGFGAPRPVGRESWLDRALSDYRVLLLDQRGTGRSTPANRQTLARIPTASAQADYLSHFRADSIAADAELIRPQITGGAPWSVLGQSFGGFCAVSYLSTAPGGLREAIITGGLPGLASTADDVYRLTYPTVAAKNAAHYDRYPQDIERARRIAALLAERPTALPGGGTLTVERFQALGHVLGSSSGSHRLHYLLEDAFVGPELSDDFLYRAEDSLRYGSAPLYALLHEACYAQGAATRWAAQRVRAEFAAFDARAALGSDTPVLFTGEMVYPWVLEHDPMLRPLAEAAELLAQRADWPPLYDAGQLARIDIPVAAAVYFDDMYVPRELSLQTAAAIRGARTWVTSEYDHDGLRVSSGAVLDRLIAMARGDA
ncbi:MAG: alpha/beta fold hydrolase [Actinobacteria bacterium]|nr:alpha/beta fold hydrolase [Actinomycetota bacterium]MBO0833912.1 alpha/beta fold hydrolase [Actinomycetota bacterium]